MLLQVWGMTGSVKQLGFTSQRYHLSFLAYSVAVCLMRTPAYPNRTKRILENVISRLLHGHVWRYMEHHWGDGVDPFNHQENVMYTGHLAMTMALFEAVTGDSRYRVDGFQTPSLSGVHATSSRHLVTDAAVQV